MELRKNGELYEVSPWALLWEDENYYLVAFDAKSAKIKHYRVDKMLKISSVKEAREGKEYFEKFKKSAFPFPSAFRPLLQDPAPSILRQYTADLLG